MSGRPRWEAFLRFAAGLLFKAYNDIHVEGAQNVPSSGAAIIAANHPTYLDPAFLMVGLTRPIRFMAWEKPFSIPLLGALMRAYGAVPVDMDKPGRASFEAGARLLRSGELFGIFPEGGRTREGQTMNPVKMGVARLAMITGAPIIPVTIAGGGQVWPKRRLLPRPGPIRVVFHAPIRVRQEDRLLWRRDKSLETELVDKLLASINRTLAPALRAEERMERLLQAEPAPPSLVVEGIPFFFLAASCWLLTPAAWRNWVAPVLPALIAYLALIVAEQLGHFSGRSMKAARHLAPWLVLASALTVAAGHVTPRAALVAALWLGAMVWLLLFRFPAYRRIRGWALGFSYSLWLASVRAIS